MAYGANYRGEIAGIYRELARYAAERKDWRAQARWEAMETQTRECLAPYSRGMGDVREARLYSARKKAKR